MNHKHQPLMTKSSEDFFRLKPLAAAVRVVIAGGLLVGSGISTVNADVHAPLPEPTNIVPLPAEVTNPPVVIPNIAHDIIPVIDQAAHGQANAVINDHVMTINQITDKATIDWKSFNIDKGYTVNFVQPSSASVALNNIHQGDASQIMGSITANGQVYLFNQNGFIFGKDSVVDTNSLVVTALNISDEAFKAGIIRVFDDNPNASIDKKAALNGNTNDPKTAVNPTAKIQINNGAHIHASKSGSVIMAAPTVDNSGSISADQQGQVILVASQDKVYLQPTSSKDPFAGLLVEVGSGGTVNNNVGGDVAVRQGNVTLAGFAVNQSGRLSATTSVNVNGSIRLLAREGAADSFDPKTNAHNLSVSTTVRSTGETSSVMLGKNSSATILADVDGGTAIDEQAQKQSVVEINANQIDMQQNASIVATGGVVNLTTSSNPLDVANTLLVGSGGRIDLESGSKIDVSGTKNVQVAMERNVAEVSVQSFNLRDAPYQKGGVLQGQKVQVDIRNLPTILDASTVASSIQKGVGERLTTGGVINLTSAGDVVVNKNAVTDISGGSVNYQSGYINTTQLVTAATGQVVDISKANPNLQYSAIFGTIKETSVKWGTTNTFNLTGLGRFENGYTDGKAGGALNIESPVTAWSGQLVAGAVTGINQLSNPVSGGSLAINAGDNGGATNPQPGQFFSTQNITFDVNAPTSSIGINDPLPSTDLVLSNQLVNQSGISQLTVKTAGTVTVAKDANLTMPALSSFNVDAGNIDVLGSIKTSGGTIALNGIYTGISNTGQLNLLTSSLLDVSGNWINQFKDGLSSPSALNAGSVNISATNRLNFAQGAQIKANGGASLDVSGNRVTAGSAGSIKLQAGTHDIEGLLLADGQLSAYGLNQGGNLTLASNKINVGTQVAEANALNLKVTHGLLDVAANSGFSSISLVSNQQDITVKANTAIALTAQNKIITSDYRNQHNTNGIEGFSQVVTLPETLRKPVTLSLNGLTGVTLETGSQINVDKGSTVNISTENLGSGLFLNGLISAPSGNINLVLKADYTSLAYNGSQSIWLGSNAELNTQGTSLINPANNTGLTTGSVLNGGNITLKADRGYVVVEKGAQLNVTGTEVVLDLPAPTPSGFAKTLIGSDAGKVAITAAEGVVLDGAISAKAGSATNLGGSLNITLDRNQRGEALGAIFPNNALLFNLIQDTKTQLPISAQFNSIPSLMNGLATLSSQQLHDSGIEQLKLSVPVQRDPNDGSLRPAGVINFNNDVNLTLASSLILDAPTLQWSGVNGQTTGNVSLISPYLQLGSASYNQVLGTSVLGGGKLTTQSLTQPIKTQWTQLNGALLMTGFSDVNLSSIHDLRLVGVQALPTERTLTGNLNTAANLTLNASQVYPTTLTDYTVSVTNPSSVLTIGGQNTDTSPLSAAGRLTFNASTINQNGVVKAPLGTIAFNATQAINFGANSVTSVSANGQTIPFGTIVNNNWVYSLPGNNNLIFNQSLLNTDTNLYEYLTVGEKHLVFQAPSIQFNQGSTVDVSGGGDLLAYQFQPGLGGSNDYLLPGSPSYQGGFAILPSLGSSLAPYDPNLSIGANDPRTSIYLGGSDTLAAGFYTVLPSRYALLPGAFLVTPQANTQDQVSTTYNQNGLAVVSGYQALAGTNSHASRTMGFLIESSADIQKHSQYNIQTANSFFTQQALTNNSSIPLLPADSGQISIDASTRLVLDGQFKVATPKGRGAKMDISAQNIEVVNSLTNGLTPGTLQLLDQNLSHLNVDSLLLGGTRLTDSSTGNTQLNVTANNVTFDANTQLKGLDLLATAKNTIEVKDGASLVSSGQVNTGDSVFNMVGSGALLRVSADKQVSVNHTVGAATGNLLIDQNATLNASKSMLLDAGSTILTGDIVMRGGALNLTSNAINIGDIPNGVGSNALNLTNQQLSHFSVDALVLNSHDAVNLYGNVGQLDAQGNLGPIPFNNLLIEAAGLSGYASNGQSASLKATQLELSNPLNAQANQMGNGQGTLNLMATNYIQGQGKFALNGFNTVNLNVDNGVVADGKSTLNVGADLNLTAGYLTTTGGSSLAVDASGHQLNVMGNNTVMATNSQVLGGSISMVANAIQFNTNAIMSSGLLNLHALTGDVLVDSKANINLAGQAFTFADMVDYTPGGTFSAQADQGAIKLASGSLVDISSGGATAAGGHFNLKATTQDVTLAGQLKATGGSASVDVAQFSVGTTFDQLITQLNQAGINSTLAIRSRVDSMIEAANTVINANNINLASDKGAVDIFGQLNANGQATGGSINLSAGDKVTLEGGSLLSATGDNGGKVSLSSVDSTLVNHSGVELKAGSTIDVTGKNGTGGVVTLSAQRMATADGINIKPIAGTVTGASQFYAEGLKKYNASLIDSTLISTINADTLNYMNASTNSVAVLGAGLTLKPGVEVDSIGDLTLATAWDFSTMSQPASGSAIIGDLTLRAAGQLDVNKSLSDGFKVTSGVQGLLNNGESWSFNLVSGADMSSADKLATIALTDAEKLAASLSKDLVLGSGASVHTGSGNINLASGGNLVFTNQTSTVYNAGRSNSSNPYGGLAANKRPVGYYPVEGGDLVIRADGDIKGAVSNQFLAGWLNRQGTVVSTRASRNTVTAWSVDPSQYQENIGSFGGGKVDISATGNINDLSVMMPTTGKQLGTSVADNNVQVLGGGQMQVTAGGDIMGGAYYLGKGEGVISAAGKITGSTSSDPNAFVSGPQLIMSGDQNDPLNGNSHLSLNAGTGIKISAVSDAMVLKVDSPEFFTYTNNSQLTLKSLAGDVNLNADTRVETNLIGMTNPNEIQLTKVYPASLNVTAFNGNVVLNNDIILFPSPVSNMNIFAQQAITSSTGQNSFIMSDANPALLPNMYSTINAANDQKLIDAASVFNTTAINASGIPGVSKGGASPLIHANTPIHSADTQPARLVTQLGDISAVQMVLPKQAIVQAGRDLINSPIQIQQINQADTSIIAAGRDIIFVTDLDRNGVPTDKNSAYQILISGPGDTLVKTGRNLDLGASVGLTTVGNLYNSALPSVGASLDVLVGLNAGTPSYAAFIDKYLNNNPLYLSEFSQVKSIITAFIKQKTGDMTLTDDQALTSFGHLTGDQTLVIQPQLNSLLTKVFFNELKIAGSASASDKSKGNKGGFEAIDTLFPGNQWQGNLSLFFSKLQTVSGGNINLYVPGGQINAGLAVAPSGSGAKTADKLGIVAQQTGDINAFVKDDFTVNTSRVFTLGGGDILIWSSEGNIDAGKGAKSALAVSVDAPYYDSNNQLVIPAPKITSGSGIRTAASPGVQAGDVFLFAPHGVVDAGEAGIGGTNVTISATAVLGANNISVGGVSTGVPQASTGSMAAGLTGTSNLTANVSQTAQTTATKDDEDEKKKKNTMLGMLSVEVLGFGE